MKNIVTIGGGTGSFVLLSGLKRHPVNLSAIVSMADDGGSTGILRDELGVLPPGDIRQCLVALSDSSDQMRQLINYRFEHGALKGHSFGNLLLSALEKINGGFLEGLEEAVKILNVKGEVIPVTADAVNLFLDLKNGKTIKGEAAINHSFVLEDVGIKRLYLKPRAQVNPHAVKKIKEADIIVIGPGNFYCSIIPNLLVHGVADAIRASKATVIFNCNLVNKNGHTERFTLDDYVDVINRYLGGNRIDFVIFNARKPSKALIKKYGEKKEFLVPFKKEDRAKRNYKVIVTDLLSTVPTQHAKSDVLARHRSLIRHDVEKLAKTIMFISEIEENKDIIRKII
ncbi:MAG: YvcK family protein [Candidatus Azambacteria bacterium]|nr:YvcK family protein [Candidatus Azambacteria bacterium]